MNTYSRQDLKDAARREAEAHERFFSKPDSPVDQRAIELRYLVNLANIAAPYEPGLLDYLVEFTA